MRRLMPLVISLTFLAPLRATGQEPDWLVYKNEKLSLFLNPLDVYFQKVEKQEERRMINPPFGLRPNGLPTLYTEEGGGEKSSNWRGYVATWIIEDEKLLLSEIDAWVFCGEKPKNFREFILANKNPANWRKATLKDVAPEKVNNGRILADWFSGELRVPKGKLLKFAHMGYGSIYEFEIIITIEGGVVKSSKTIDNRNRELPSSHELEKQELERMKSQADSASSK